MNIAQEIKDRLTMREVFIRYGYTPSRSDKVSCPFHCEKEPSMNIYANNKRFHCFGCGADGNIIDFVMQLFNLSFKQAIVKVNYDFSLGLLNRSLTRSERERMRKQERERKQEIEDERRAREEKDNVYWKLLDIWIENDKITSQYKGLSKCAFDYPEEYWKALTYKQYAAYQLDSMERGLNK